jgi:Na+-driven multidrug efflux pump
MILYGIGFGLMPIVAYSEGARLYQRLQQSVSVALKASLLIAAFSSIILEIFAEFIISLFSNDPALTEIAVPALRIYVSILVFVAPILVYINMFIGLGKGTLAMFLLFFRDTVLLIPLLIVLSSRIGLLGAWLALPISNIISLCLVYFWAKKELWRFKTA